MGGRGTINTGVRLQVESCLETLKLNVLYANHVSLDDLTTLGFGGAERDLMLFDSINALSHVSLWM